jgi:carbon starvation protein
MAFSTFVFDTLDVSMRLGRYLLQELFKSRSRMGAAIATLVTAAVPVCILWGAGEGAWVKFWTLFGASNQLLAALTLLSITYWLYRARKRVWFTLLPMLFVLIVTLWSLLQLMVANFKAARGFDPEIFNALSAAALIGLALFLAVTALFRVRLERRETLAPETAL